MKARMAGYWDLSGARLTEIQKPLQATPSEKKTEKVTEKVVSDVESLVKKDS